MYNAPGGKVCTVTNYSTMHFENSVAREKAAEALNAKMNRDANIQIWILNTALGYEALALKE